MEDTQAVMTALFQAISFILISLQQLILQLWANNLESTDMAVQEITGTSLFISLKQSGHFGILAQAMINITNTLWLTARRMWILVFPLHNCLKFSDQSCERVPEACKQSMNICESSQCNNEELMNSRPQNCCPHTSSPSAREDVSTVFLQFRHQSHSPTRPDNSRVCERERVHECVCVIIEIALNRHNLHRHPAR